MTGAPLLRAEGLRRRYPARGMIGRGDEITALDGVGLTVTAGEAVGVLGASGAGKSTLGRILLALERPDAGRVWFDGNEISSMPESKVRPLRRRFQPVLQDSLAALDPRMPVGASVSEPLDGLGIGDRSARRERVAEVLGLVGLNESFFRRHPGSLSGGERQRVAIARSLAPEPELLVLDEPVSSLDAPVALSVVDLLAELRTRCRLTVVMISHDVHVIRRLCDRVLVMGAGRIVEEGGTRSVFGDPHHAVTRSLLESAPILRVSNR